MKWTSEALRESFLEFFAGREHLRLPSASLIPVDDPTLLLIGAGMAPFKPYFRGDETPPAPRVTTCQKCVRADDIDLVGHTARHHTFFEMLGNFSFGDYFKSEACAWAWEYLTKTVGLASERLWVTIHSEDEEADAIWQNEVGVPAQRIVRLSDNFWGPIGLTGPCGPCSEICYDQGPQVGCGRPECAPGCDCDRYLEIWNLVFTGLNKNEHGTYDILPAPCIDTGLGFERLLMVLQGVPNPYETDLFRPLMEELRHLTGRSLGESPGIDMALKVVADHARAVIFMLADGISPSNEGRGYVLRRVLRRAVRFGRVLGQKAPFLSRLISPLVRTMGGDYPELGSRSEYVASLAQREEEQFFHTLEAGMDRLEDLMERHTREGGNILPGDEVFRLYDTYGFPPELTREIAAERALAIDEPGLKAAMEEQRRRARADQESKPGSEMAKDEALDEVLRGLDTRPVFVGYDTIETKTRILALFRDGIPVEHADSIDDEPIEVLLESCPFYGESGGQVGDTGEINAPGCYAPVEDTRRNVDGISIPLARVAIGTLEVGMEVTARVDLERRELIMAHHTATHLLQAALRARLGGHVAQAGSLVTPNRFRFDFSHHQALAPDDLAVVESQVNAWIRANRPVSAWIMSLEDAQQAGALAFFGEKYSDEVRMIEVSGISRELCGGTHVKQTGQIGTFLITGEEAVGTGVRRIEAVCGAEALNQVQEIKSILHTAGRLLKVPPSQVVMALEASREAQKARDHEWEALKARVSCLMACEFAQRARQVEGVTVLTAMVPDTDRGALLALGDRLKARLKSVVLVLGTCIDDKAALVAMVTTDLMKRGFHAGKLITPLASRVGGKGGGRPDTAQAGGKDPGALEQALEMVDDLVRDVVKSASARPRGE